MYSILAQYISQLLLCALQASRFSIFWALFLGTFFSFLLFFEPVNSPRYHRQNQTIKSIKLRGIFRRPKFMPGGGGEPTFPGVSFPQKIRRGKERFKTQGGGGRAVTAFRSWVQPFNQTRAGQRPRGLGQSPKKRRGGGGQ